MTIHPKNFLWLMFWNVLSFFNKKTTIFFTLYNVAHSLLRPIIYQVHHSKNILYKYKILNFISKISYISGEYCWTVIFSWKIR